MTARAIWQFAPDPPMFGQHGGFVSTLPPRRRGGGGGGGVDDAEAEAEEGGARRLVAFSCDGDATQDECWLRAFEVDARGAELARITVPPTPAYYAGWPGAYRAVPWETLGGEREVA